MPLKKPVHANATYTVRFSSHITSKGSALIAVGWVPKDGNAVPDPRDIVVAAGGTSQIDGKVPAFADARLMEIIVDVPDNGSGQLEVLENGKLHSDATIAEDTTWKMLVEEAQ